MCVSVYASALVLKMMDKYIKTNTPEKSTIDVWEKVWWTVTLCACACQMWSVHTGLGIESGSSLFGAAGAGAGAADGAP